MIQFVYKWNLTMKQSYEVLLIGIFTLNIYMQVSKLKTNISNFILYVDNRSTCIKHPPLSFCLEKKNIKRKWRCGHWDIEITSLYITWNKRSLGSCKSWEMIYFLMNHKKTCWYKNLPTKLLSPPPIPRPYSHPVCPLLYVMRPVPVHIVGYTRIL